MTKFFTMAVIRKVFVIFALCVLSVLLSIIFFFNSDVNPNIRSFNHQSKNIVNVNGHISGRFVAQDNYLSLVTIRFESKELMGVDSVFRIKNLYEKNWHNVATVSAAQYFALPQYTFGFQGIENSFQKTYEFEVFLLDKPPSAPELKLGSEYPVLISHYQFPISSLLENKQLLVDFSRQKLTYYLHEKDSWKVFVVYSIPLLLYCIYIAFGKKLTSSIYALKVQNALLVLFRPYSLLIFISIFLDIFIIRKYSDLTTIILITLWLLEIMAYKLESRYSFVIGMTLLVLCPFFSAARMDWMEEKAAIWAVLFFLSGCIAAISEFKREVPPYMSFVLGRADKLPKKLSYALKYLLSIVRNVISIVLESIVKFDLFVGVHLGRFTNYTFKSIKNFFTVVIIIVVAVLIVLGSLGTYLRFMNYRDRQLKNPGVPHVEPTLVYPGTKVVLYGERFGDNSNSDYALVLNNIRIHADYWEDHKIVFTMPLGWEPGNLSLWIEKPIEWEGKNIIEKTKPNTIKLLPIMRGFTPDDDLYFEQIKTWRKETKELNGYK